MTNIFEALKDFIVPIIDNKEKTPLHVGEVADFWMLLTMLEEGVSIYQLALNTTIDDELIHALKNGEETSKNIIERLIVFMKNEGIPLTRPSEQRPKSDPNAIPLGVKQTDAELVNLISVKVAAEIALIGQALSMTGRNDAGIVLFEALFEIFKYGSSLKNLMRKRGWFKVPPFYYPPGAPNN